MKKPFAYIIFGVIVLLLCFMFKNQLTSVLGTRNEHVEFPDGYVVGSWLWKSPDELTDQEVKELLVFAHEEKINTIFLDIGKYLDIIETQSGVIETEEVIDFENSLKFFIQESQQRGISVEALSGSTLWTKSSHSYIPSLLLNYVLDFNKRNPDTQFSGFQYDIEFYNQKDYSTHKQEYVRNYLNLVKKLSELVKDHNNKSNVSFRLGFAIPFWFSDSNVGNLFQDLVQILNQNEGSYLAIMAYRNYQDGDNGSISLIKDEVDFVQHNAQNLSLLIAQETDRGEFPKTTFYGRTKQELKKAFVTITEYFQGYSSLKGLAIHHLDSYKYLSDN